MLAIDLCHQYLDPEQVLVDSDDVLVICPSLVTITGDRETSLVEPGTLPDGTRIPGIILTEPVNEPGLSLAHFSVKEFLTSERVKESGLPNYWLSPEISHLSITQTCLVYLVHCCRHENEVVAPNLNPLISYAAKEWPVHYRAIGEKEVAREVDELGVKMMSTLTRHFKTWSDLMYGTSHYDASLRFPLKCMISLGVLGVVRMMLDAGADPNEELSALDSPLIEAVRSKPSNAVEMIHILLEKGADIDQSSDLYGTVLHEAVGQRNAVLAQILLDKGAEPNVYHSKRGTALGVAIGVYKADVEIGLKLIDMLLNYGADVNANADSRRSCIHIAIELRLAPMVLHLIEKRYDIRAEHGEHDNSLVHAASLGCDDIVDILTRDGADLYSTTSSRRNQMRSAIFAAAKGGKVSTVRLLLERGAEVKDQHFTWEVCRKMALAKRGVSTMRLLVINGATLDLRDTNTNLSEWKTKRIQQVMAVQNDSNKDHKHQEENPSPADLSEFEDADDFENQNDAVREETNALQTVPSFVITDMAN